MARPVNRADESSEEEDYFNESGLDLEARIQEYYLGSRPPFPGHSNVNNITNTDLHYLTKRDSSIAGIKGPWPMRNSITDMICRRQSGLLNTIGGFSRREMCSVRNYKLPYRMKIVDTYRKQLLCGLYSPDGKTLLTVAQDHRMRLYDTSSAVSFKHKRVIPCMNNGRSLLDAALSPDCQKIAYCYRSPSIHMVDAEPGGIDVVLDLSPGEERFGVMSLLFSPCGKEILCSGNDGDVYVYNLDIKSRTQRIFAHEVGVNSIAFGDESAQVLYSGGNDGFCRVWDRRVLSEDSHSYPEPVGILAGHLNSVVQVDSRGDGRHFISNSKDQSIKLWDIRVMSSKATQDVARKLVLEKDLSYSWSTLKNKLFALNINLKGDTSVATYRRHSVKETLNKCQFSPAFSTGQRYIVTGCDFGRVIIYDVLSGEVALKLQGHSDLVRDVSWHPYRPEIISSSWDGYVKCWSHVGINPDGEEQDDGKEDKGSSSNAQPLRKSRRIADQSKRIAGHSRFHF